MNSLVGHTGFVGSNLCRQGNFAGQYNSQNIGEAFGTSPDVLYYSGLPAEKFLADSIPEQDMQRVRQAADNIVKINPKRVVLISTVDVYSDTDNRTENNLCPAQNPYGANRLWLESFVADNFLCHNIIRLPGLFGQNIKKNFIYDIISYIPSMLNDKKFAELSNIKSEIYNMYTLQDNGFYRLNADVDRKGARGIFEQLNFSALNFTDSRAVFQFYNLDNLFFDIQTAINKDISLLNIASEPLSAAQLYRFITGNEFVNELAKKPPYYNFKSIHADKFGGSDGYLYSSQELLQDIKKFVERYSI